MSVFFLLFSPPYFALVVSFIFNLSLLLLDLTCFSYVYFIFLCICTGLSYLKHKKNTQEEETSENIFIRTQMAINR